MCGVGPRSLLILATLTGIHDYSPKRSDAFDWQEKTFVRKKNSRRKLNPDLADTECGFCLIKCMMSNANNTTTCVCSCVACRIGIKEML